MFIAFSFLLGLIIGSFLNVLVLRAHTGQPLTGRSKCMACGRTLTWTDLIPVVSYFWLRGRCRRCGSRISFQYPAVEIVTGIVFALVAGGLGSPLADPLLTLAFWLNGFHLLFLWVLMAGLVAISVYDIRHHIIPDEWLIALTPVAFLVSVLGADRFSEGVFVVANGFLAAGIFFGLFWLVWYLSGGRLLGLGDGKLVAVLGLWLGLSAGGTALIIAFWIGAIFGLLIIALSRLAPVVFNLNNQSLKSLDNQKEAGGQLKRRLNVWALQLSLVASSSAGLKTAVPFGPFLALSAFLVWFFGWEIMTIITWFSFLS